MTNEELVARIRAGVDETENMLKLWQQNRGLIHTIARKYAAYEDIEDLEQQGYIGLCDAVQGYRPEDGAPFAAYAAFWVRQSIQRYVEECSTLVRIPTHRREDIGKYRRMCAAFEREYGREPTEQEASRYLGVSLEIVQRVKQAACMEALTSLDRPASAEQYGETTLADLQPGSDDVEGSVLDAVQQEQLKAVIWTLVDALPGKQAPVLRMRFQEGLTLEEIGAKLGITRQGVWDQERHALRELRKPKRARRLLPFRDEYISAHAFRGNGAGTFNRTWTSSTEKLALKLSERYN
ncbi:MAG: sigma-70 family RNA polymerase sigma factor [Lachnospiraceae bacterium]|nr:sigma-70 family RNA polymerase sigma factor [Lachnospiraceae bacterium]